MKRRRAWSWKDAGLLDPKIEPGKTLFDLGYGECRFAITPDKPFRFCADPVDEGRVYCRAHEAIAYVDRKKSAGQSN